MTGSETIRRGSCLCKAVKYEVKGDPLVCRVCHCVNCRKATGSAFMSNGFFLRPQVRVVGGQEKLKVFRDTETASGVALDRQFCTECGSNVLLYSADPEVSKKFIIVGLGTLDDGMDWLPKSELFPEQKRHWVTEIRVQPKQDKAKL